MAASIQKVTEEIVLKLLRNISQKTKEKIYVWLVELL